MQEPVLILLVEHTPARRIRLASLLRGAGYRCLTATNGNAALRIATAHHPDLLLLDLELTGLAGLEVVRRVRGWSHMPVFVFCGQWDAAHRIAALDAGADLCLPHGIEDEELLALLRAASRHIQWGRAQREPDEPFFVCGGLRVDYAAGCVYLQGQALHLTPIEYRLLCLLCRNAGKVLTHTYLTEQLWGHSGKSELASLRVFMAALRRKLAAHPNAPDYIQTFVGVGYRLDPNAQG